MRTFTDNDGRSWQAALLNGSYGNVTLLFSPMQGDGIKQQMLDAANLVEAEAYLQQLDDDALRALLDEAPDWDPAAGMM